MWIGCLDPSWLCEYIISYSSWYWYWLCYWMRNTINTILSSQNNIKSWWLRPVCPSKHSIGAHPSTQNCLQLEQHFEGDVNATSFSRGIWSQEKDLWGSMWRRTGCRYHLMVVEIAGSVWCTMGYGRAWFSVTSTMWQHKSRKLLACQTWLLGSLAGLLNFALQAAMQASQTLVTCSR